jgi:hypothetical protein
LGSLLKLFGREHTYLGNFSFNDVLRHGLFGRSRRPRCSDGRS